MLSAVYYLPKFQMKTGYCCTQKKRGGGGGGEGLMTVTSRIAGINNLYLALDSRHIYIQLCYDTRVHLDTIQHREKLTTLAYNTPNMEDVFIDVPNHDQKNADFYYA